MRIKRIPFDVKSRPEIESGKYKVETRCGFPVRIVCWDIKKGKEDEDYVPIFALIDYGDARGEAGSYYMEHGCWNRHDIENHNRMDLFIVTDEPDLNKFEAKLMDCLWKTLEYASKFQSKPEEFTQAIAEELLPVAFEVATEEADKAVEPYELPNLNSKQFLTWIYERMVYIHGEDGAADYMRTFKSIIDSLKDD